MTLTAPPRYHSFPSPFSSCKTAASEVRKTAMDRSVRPRHHSMEAMFTELRLNALGIGWIWDGSGGIWYPLVMSK